MKKLLFTSILFAAISAQASDNWTNSTGTPWKNSSGQCWRNASWTPATAHPDCDGALKPESKGTQVSQVTKPAQVDVSKPTATLAPRVAPAPKEVIKTSFSTDTLFDFDKSVIKPEGRRALDGLISKLKEVNLEVVIVVGHTDSVGTDAYNQKLGLRRAEAVKAYFISKGVERSRVYTESKGESQPRASNKTAAGRAQNRRVEVEVVGVVK